MTVKTSADLAEFILVIAYVVVTVEVFTEPLLDYTLEDFSDDAKDYSGPRYYKRHER